MGTKLYRKGDEVEKSIQSSPFKKKLLEGKVALITGAAHGIGLVVARTLAEHGASVVITDIKRENGERETKKLCDSRLKAAFFATDLRKESDIKAMVRYTLKTFGRIDILVNNARPRLQQLSYEESTIEWDLAFDVLLKASALTVKYALPALEQSKGLVINMTSTNAFSVSHQPASYHAAKAGVVQLTKWLAYDLGKKGIRVNAVCPGLVDLYDDKKPLTADPVNRRVAELSVPLKRAATAEDIAHLILFLCSEGASYITGQMIVIDGGITLGDHFHDTRRGYQEGLEDGKNERKR